MKMYNQSLCLCKFACLFFKFFKIQKQYQTAWVSRCPDSTRLFLWTSSAWSLFSGRVYATFHSEAWTAGLATLLWTDGRLSGKRSTHGWRCLCERGCRDGTVRCGCRHSQNAPPVALPPDVVWEERAMVRGICGRSARRATPDGMADLAWMELRHPELPNPGWWTSHTICNKTK